MSSTKSNKYVIKNKHDVASLNNITIDDFTNREKLLYNKLNRYYRSLKKKYMKTMLEIIWQKSHVSLRLLDWFVTRYAKDNDTTYIINNRDDLFYVHISYKSQLRSYRKKHFDPFKRNGKFLYSYDKKNNDLTVKTTIGQLNFFKWAIKYKIIKYVQDNFDIILSAMIKSNKEYKNRKKYKIEKKKKNKKEKKKKKEKKETKEEKVKIKKFGIDIGIVKIIDDSDDKVVEKYVISFD